VRVAYGDPPYPGCAELYRDHPDYAGEVDHVELLRRMDADYDGWLLHTSAPALPMVLHICEEHGLGPYRVMAWVKPFAAFKRNVSVAYAWEPVLVKPARKPKVTAGETFRDFVEAPAVRESITMKRGLTGAKPERVCMWAFAVLGLTREDELHDLFPGTGAVTSAWEKWTHRKRSDGTQTTLPVFEKEDE
jgi:hypothetical protein